MLKLDVNIVVKQAPWPDSYPEQIANIREMYELHKNNNRVVLVDPKVNILDVIAISDILVSEESSTMSECVMMGKPAISVNNWLIPDTNPSRLPVNNYDYVIRTDKEYLTECVSEVMSNYEKYAGNAQCYSDTHFSNIGSCISMMFDILDAKISGRESSFPVLRPKEHVRLSGKKYFTHLIIITKREVVSNYCVTKPGIKQMYKIYRRLRKREDCHFA